MKDFAKFCDLRMGRCVRMRPPRRHFPYSQTFGFSKQAEMKRRQLKVAEDERRKARNCRQGNEAVIKNLIAEPIKSTKEEIMKDLGLLSYLRERVCDFSMEEMRHKESITLLVKEVQATDMKLPKYRRMNIFATVFGKNIRFVDCLIQQHWQLFDRTKAILTMHACCKHLSELIRKRCGGNVRILCGHMQRYTKSRIKEAVTIGLIQDRRLKRYDRL